MTSNLETGHATAQAAANISAQEFADVYFNGGDGGACGFAWVTFYPANKGNTRAGKIERKMFEQIGFRRDYTGKAWQLWNPAGYPGQSIDCKFVGAARYAQVFLAETGMEVVPASRMD
jgi:hypothetical protein